MSDMNGSSKKASSLDLEKRRRQTSLEGVNKVENSQSRNNAYSVKFGRPLLYLIPLMLAALTIVNIAFKDNTLVFNVLLYVFIIILVLFAFNSVMLARGAFLTEKAFKLRLNHERLMGRPIESLRGFDSIRKNIGKTLLLLKVISFVSFVSLLIYAAWLGFELVDNTNSLTEILIWAGIGFTLVTFGLSLLIKSVRMNITDINGLIDYYIPSSHELFLDNLFGDTFFSHLDPFMKLKWDEFCNVISGMLREDFINKIKENEPDEVPVRFAIEKLLYLTYLEYQGVITLETVQKELSEVLDFSSGMYNLNEGADINEKKRYFSIHDFHKVFQGLIEKYSSGFYNIIDRLQIELMDNIKTLAMDPIYLDISSDEFVAVHGILNIFIFLFNNQVNEKVYYVKVVAPGFQPEEMEIKVKSEGRGKFEIPHVENLELTSDQGIDCVGLMADILKNGDALWLSIEPLLKGTQTLQIYLMDEDRNIIEGRAFTVDIFREFKYILKKLSGMGSIFGGILSPLLKSMTGS
ncbi:MAG: hypothetical protein ACTSVI_07710 [Promethearchaeota archaeon]